MMKVVAFFHMKEVQWAIPPAEIARLQERFPELRLVSVEDPERLAAELVDADGYVGWRFPRSQFACAQKLRWIHSASAGVEETLFPELCHSDVILTNSAGLHSVSIPEHVLGQMFVLARNFHEAARLQARHEWNRWQLVAFGASIRELDGSNLLILGAGAIGTSLGRLAAGLHMKVRVLRRDPSRAIEGIDGVYGPSSLHELLRWADFVVLAVPLTSETEALIGAEELAQMKPDAFLINIARGEVVDESALIEALREKRIAGAGLDVFAQEPLPPSHPFWDLSNVVITPHLSGYTAQYFENMLALFEDNLERFLRRRPLRNIVDKQAGYSRVD